MREKGPVLSIARLGYHLEVIEAARNYRTLSQPAI